MDSSEEPPTNWPHFGFVNDYSQQNFMNWCPSWGDSCWFVLEDGMFPFLRGINITWNGWRNAIEMPSEPWKMGEIQFW